MRILIDALAARYGGAAYAVISVARHLARREEVAEVTVVARSGTIVAQGLAREGEATRCRVLPASGHDELIRRLVWEGIRLPALLRDERCDVLISMSGMLPRAPTCRLTCLISNPVMYEQGGVANRLRRWAVRRTTTRAQCVVVPSRMMAGLASGWVKQPCTVLPWGVDHHVFRPSGIPGRDILCVADFYAHKRHDLLVDAWLRLPAPRPRLRLIGNPTVDPSSYARLAARIESLPEPDSVAVQHRVSLAELVGAYQHARVLVMPSEHESFCMPLAESMACGVPAVARDIDSLRETAGAAADYVSAEDPDLWAGAIQRLIEDDREHARLRELAQLQARRFSWEAFAEHLLKCL